MNWKSKFYSEILIIILIIIALLSLTVLSQLTPTTNIVTDKTQITPTISIEENKTCTTNFYNEIREIYGNCAYYHNYTSCLNTTGPDTDCSSRQTQWNFNCKTGDTTITTNKTECKPSNKFIITINGIKKEIDSSNWGPCVYKQENNCLIVTCVSLYDGAHKGQFTDCNGGKSCQRYEICDNSIKSFYKNSRDDFVQDDSSFYQQKLPVKETT